MFLSLAQFGDWGLLILRIAVGAIFLAHGTQKLAMWKMQSSDQMPSRMLAIMRILSIAEPLGGVAMLSGFAVPIAAVGLGIVMAGAIFFKTRVWHKRFSEEGGWEFDALILAAVTTLFLLGSGRFGVDAFLSGYQIW